MSRIRSLLVSALLVGAASVSNATTLGFEELPAGMQVGSAYSAEGVLFDTPGWEVRNETYGGIVIVPGGSNYVHLASETTIIRFVQPGEPSRNATTTLFEFDNAGLRSSYGYYAGLNIVAKDLNGNVVDVASVSPIGMFESRDVFTTTLESQVGIHTVEFGYVINPGYSGAVLPIDNIHFGELHTAPEPSTMLLLGAGLAGALGFSARKRKMRPSPPTGG